jgi:pyridoxine 5-phosphate synthase
MTQLGVNIDHIATLRQLRHASFPDILLAARTCEAAGADSIVVHLREDRRHIQDADVRLLRRFVKTRLNLEMSIAPTIVSIACRVGPDQATLVPEKRQELTTEGGLDVARLSLRVGRAVDKLRQAGIDVSLFIEPDLRQVQAAVDVGAGAVEIHTGHYADARSKEEFQRHLSRIRKAVDAARAKGLIVNAGHGLDYANVCGIASLSGVRELNIGYAIVCHAVFVGLARAVRQMKTLVSRRS